MKILPIFIPHLGCPFDCVYCDQHQITKTAKPDLDNIFQQAQNFCRKNSEQAKEIAFFGGTFTGLPLKLQHQLLNSLAPLLDSKTAIRLSTRPDKIDREMLQFLSAHGVQTIELGVQSFDQHVLDATKRGYSSQRAFDSCKLIKAQGLNLGIQIMPGLPGFSAASLQTTLAKIIQLKPDFVRIYPTIVLADTKLDELYQSGAYQPLSLEEAVEISANIFRKLTVAKISISKLGLHSDLDSTAVTAGPYHQSFGELVRAKILSEQITKSYQTNQTVHISPQDVSLLRGFGKTMLIDLKKRLQIAQLPVIIDSSLQQNQFILSTKPADKMW
jgi:histone acetyltransferase (RNA polymerase elongator complex component)